MRSFVVSRGELCARGAGFLMRLRRDRVFAEAAEASFYLMTSLVPFLSLLFAFTGLFLPEDLLETQGRGQIMVTPLSELVEKNTKEAGK